MKLIEWYVDVGRGTIEVDDNATMEEIEALVTKEISKKIAVEMKKRGYARTDEQMLRILILSAKSGMVSKNENDKIKMRAEGCNVRKYSNP